MAVRQGLALALVSVSCALLLESASPRAAADYAVHLPVSVLHNGAAVKGLTPADFVVSEDGTPRAIDTVAVSPVPLSLAIIVDTSPQMRGPWMNEIFGAVRDLVAKGLTADDEVAIYVFARQISVLQKWASRDVLLDSRYRVPDGPAAAPLFEALSRASKDTDHAKHRRRAVLAITGGSTSDGWHREAGPAFQEPMGRTTPPSGVNPSTNPWQPSPDREKALQALKHRELTFFAIGLDTPKVSDRKLEPMPPVNVEELRQVSESTGGYFETVASTERIPSAIDRLRDELASQYLVSYRSPVGGDGRYHAVKVDVKHPDYKVRARSGYAAIRDR